MRFSIFSTCITFAASLFASGCVSSQLELAQNDPAQPGAATPAPAPRSGVLGPDFDPLAEPAPSADAGARKYTCPMHPEIVKDEPGNCPICHMKLVPLKEKHSHPGEH